MTNEQFESIRSMLNLDPKDRVILCFEGAAMIPDQKTGNIAWNFLSATYVGYEAERIIVDTDVGRELVKIDSLVRFIKASNLERPRLS